MANYSLVVNSTFQPFTYQELAAPLDRQELYHEKLAEEYDKLSTQADVLEAMGANDKDKSSGAYSRYKSYSDALRKEADALYRHGLNTESRQRLSDLRRRYNTDIVPIQNAWNKRQEEAKIQMQAQIQHPELRFTRDAANTSLDEYVRNPEGGFGVVNLNNIAAQMSEAAKNLAKQAREGRIEGIDNYTSRYITPYGVDPNLIRNWMSDPSKSPTLTNMMQEVLRANGITDENFLNTPNGKRIMQEAIGAAQRGAWSAVGEDKEHILENFEARTKYKYQVEHPGNNDPTESLIDDSLIQIPMQGADYSHAGEQERAMQTLGFRKDKDGRLVYNHGRIDIDVDLRDQKRKELKEKIDNNTATEQEKRQYRNLTSMPVLSRAEREKSRFRASVNLYNNDGTLMTKEQFAAQGKDANEKAALEKYYKRIEEANQSLGIGKGITYNHRELTDYYNKLRNKNAAQFANIRALNYNKGDWNATSKQYPVTEIKSYKGGKPVYDTKKMSLGELLERKNSNKEDISVASYWSDVEGQEGLILATTEDGKQHRYFISVEDMPESNVTRARALFREADSLRRAGRAADAKARIETALGYLHTGFTLHNGSYDQNIVRQPSLKQQGLAQ